MDAIPNLSTILSAIGILVILTNLIVQVVKKATWDKVPTNIVVVIVSMVLTLGAFFGYCQVNAITVTWYMVFAAVVLGMLVSYAAMFGFDKLTQAIGQLGKGQ